MTHKKYSVMVVDDNVTNLTVAKRILTDYYEVFPVTSGAKALSLLKSMHPDMILLDIDMPVIDGFEVMKVITANPKTKDIPVIFLTALDGGGNELEGLKLGAVDYITKPFSAPLLLKRIELHISLFNYTHNLESEVEEKTEIVKELQYAITHTIVDLVETRDGSTGDHVMRTQSYVKLLLETLRQERFYQDELDEINDDMAVEASQLHDVGKIGIPDSILLKPDILSPDEYDVMKKHVSIGEEAINKAMSLTRDKEFLQYAAVITATHHEKWDGTGYPRGLRGRSIPLLGRIMAIADVYDALVSRRPYKMPVTHERAVEILRGDSGIHFHPQLIDMFLKAEDSYRRIALTIQDGG